jgi:hypothetical protein
MEWRERLYVAPLYGIACLRARPCLHASTVALIDLSLLLVGLALFYGMGLGAGWGALGQYRLPQNAMDRFVIFFLMILPGCIIVLAVFVTLFFIVKAAGWCFHRLSHPSYVLPSRVYVEEPPSLEETELFVELET